MGLRTTIGFYFAAVGHATNVWTEEVVSGM